MRESYYKGLYLFLVDIALVTHLTQLVKVVLNTSRAVLYHINKTVLTFSHKLTLYIKPVVNHLLELLKVLITDPFENTLLHLIHIKETATVNVYKLDYSLVLIPFVQFLPIKPFPQFAEPAESRVV